MAKFQFDKLDPKLKESMQQDYMAQEINDTLDVFREHALASRKALSKICDAKTLEEAIHIADDVLEWMQKTTPKSWAA